MVSGSHESRETYFSALMMFRATPTTMLFLAVVHLTFVFELYSFMYEPCTHNGIRNLIFCEEKEACYFRIFRLSQDTSACYADMNLALCLYSCLNNSAILWAVSHRDFLAAGNKCGNGLDLILCADATGLTQFPSRIPDPHVNATWWRTFSDEIWDMIREPKESCWSVHHELLWLHTENSNCLQLPLVHRFFWLARYGCQHKAKCITCFTVTGHHKFHNITWEFSKSGKWTPEPRRQAWFNRWFIEQQTPTHYEQERTRPIEFICMHIHTDVLLVQNEIC